MWGNFILLFGLTLLPWLFFAVLPKANPKLFKLVLSFSGSYLFSITLLHILPEIYQNTESMLLTGGCILFGFFLQIFLSFFARGIEHGHLHHSHAAPDSLPLGLVLSISVHAFLEGNMLVHPFHEHEVHDNHSLMLGMLLHKVPEAFALLSILYSYSGKPALRTVVFVLYALLSPLGMMCGTYAYMLAWLTPFALSCVFAVIAGNFMHISTTIFFESSPGHELRNSATWAKLLGAVAAVLFESLNA